MCWTPLYANKHKSHGTENVKKHNRTTQKTKKMSNTFKLGKLLTITV